MVLPSPSLHTRAKCNVHPSVDQASLPKKLTSGSCTQCPRLNSHTHLHTLHARAAMHAHTQYIHSVRVRRATNLERRSMLKHYVHTCASNEVWHLPERIHHCLNFGFHPRRNLQRTARGPHSGQQGLACFRKVGFSLHALATQFAHTVSSNVTFCNAAQASHGPDWRASMCICTRLHVGWHTRLQDAEADAE